MPNTVPLDLQIRCVQREIGLRHKVYPNRISTGRMKPAQAKAEIEAMEAVLDTLQTLMASSDAKPGLLI